MPNPQLVDYIRLQLSAGETREKIRNTLITGGWKAADIDEALAMGGAIETSPAVVTIRRRWVRPLEYTIGGTLGVLILLAGSAYAYAYIEGPSILAGSFGTTVAGTKGYSTDVSIMITSTTTNTSVDVANDIDLQDVNNRKVQGSVTLNASQFSVKAEYKYVNSIFFGRLDALPSLLLPYASSSVGVWYGISKAELLSLLGTTTLPTNTRSASSTAEFLQKLFSSGAFTISGAPMIVTTSNGLEFEYTVHINKDALLTSLQEELDSHINSNTSATAEAYSKTASDGLSFGPARIRVTALGNIPTFIEVPLSYTSPTIPNSVAYATTTITVSNLNHPVSIDAPSQWTDLGQILQKYRQSLQFFNAATSNKLNTGYGMPL